MGVNFISPDLGFLGGNGPSTFPSVVVSGATTTGSLAVTDAITTGAIVISGTSVRHRFNGTDYFGLDSGQVNIFNSLDFLMTGGSKESGRKAATGITADQTDYDPFGGGTMFQFSTVVVTSDAPRTINSMIAGTGGRRLRFVNGNTDVLRTLTLLHDDGATGTAAQRFLCAANVSVIVPANGMVDLWYDGISARWRVHAGI